MGVIISFLALYGLVVVCCQHATAATVEDERRLRLKLFGNQAYDTEIRPVHNKSDRITVGVFFDLQSIHRLDEIKQSMQTSGWLSLSWTDEFLRWNPEEYGGLTSILISPSKVWKPDLTLDNGLNGYISVGSDHFMVMVSGETGAVTWYPGDIYLTVCQVDVTFYPFDTQSCHIVFGSWAYDESLMLLQSTKDKVQFGAYGENGQWTIVKSKTRKYEEVYDDTTLSYVEFTVVIRRKPMYYILNIILPVFMMSLMGLLVFLLPAESGEKMSMSVTVLLALAVFLTLIGETMPKTSQTASLLAIYLVLVLAVDAISVMLSAVSLHFYYQKPRPKHTGNRKGLSGNIGNVLRKLFSNSPVKPRNDSLPRVTTVAEYAGPNGCENMKPQENGNIPEKHPPLSTNHRISEQETCSLPDGIRIAQMIDRISFIILTSISVLAIITISAVLLSQGE